jgi:hypothetical protein
MTWRREFDIKESSAVIVRSRLSSLKSRKLHLNREFLSRRQGKNGDYRFSLIRPNILNHNVPS